MEPFLHCVKCGSEKTAGNECPECGIFYEKAEQAFTEKEKQKTVIKKATLQPCPSCFIEISKNAQSCPHCGDPKKLANPAQKNEKPRASSKTESFIALAIIAVLIAGFIYSQIEKVEGRSYGNNQAIVSKNEYGDTWPYTIPEGTLNCRKRMAGGYEKLDVTISYNGNTYAINGSAMGAHEFLPLERIWKDNPQYPGSKIPDPGIIKRGLQLCQ